MSCFRTYIINVYILLKQISKSSRSRERYNFSSIFYSYICFCCSVCFVCLFITICKLTPWMVAKRRFFRSTLVFKIWIIFKYNSITIQYQPHHFMKTPEAPDGPDSCILLAHLLVLIRLLTAIDRGSDRAARSQATVMDQQAWDEQDEKMEVVLGAARKKTWGRSFIFIALPRVSWENIIRSMFDASCLASSPFSLSVYPRIDTSNKCNMIERFVFFLF